MTDTRFAYQFPYICVYSPRNSLRQCCELVNPGQTASWLALIYTRELLLSPAVYRHTQTYKGSNFPGFETVNESDILTKKYGI